MPDPSPQFDTVAPEFDQEVGQGIQQPPTNWKKILLQLGPGMVIAGSIVGSGELIVTTKTGAQAGIELLWLILFGCLIKVFVQIELGRYAITHGQTTLNALNGLPGKIGPLNFMLWFWWVMMIASTIQQGGIVGGVGQSLAIAVPITGDFLQAVAQPSDKELALFVEWEEDLSGDRSKWNQLSSSRQSYVELRHRRLQEDLARLPDGGAAILKEFRESGEVKDPFTWDDRLWALAATLLTVCLLYRGRYKLLQNVSTVLVVGFTLITVGNVIALQTTENWRLSLADLWRGFSFRLPEGESGAASVKTALAAFGIIGVGATELIVYPYWCIEKGYARFTGKRSSDPSWAERARGWMRVMQYDALLSMVVYTIATMAFYVMGVAVLHREGRDPDDMRMVSTLAAAYVPVFGEYAKWLFLLGAMAVLYSTFLIANAGHARLFTDALKVMNAIDRNDQRQHDKWLSMFCVVLPLISLLLFWAGINPVQAVLLAGVSQAIMLPLIGFGALYYRFTATDPRLKPTRLWDVALIASFLALVVTGIWGVYSRFS